jgi:microcystin-dependent protein
MAEPFIGQISLFAFAFAPRNWAFCNGQTMSIAQNQALFSLLGTTFGGNGQSTFGLPNLQGRANVSSGPNFSQGQIGGEEMHTLTTAETPAHTHSANGTTLSTNTVNTPTGTLLNSPSPNLYTNQITNLVALQPTTIANAGGSQPHENRQPYTVVNFCIALQGLFPSRN